MRYSVLIAFSITIIIALSDSAATGKQDELKRFPDGFQFGTATASYQVEGAWDVGGKTESIWDHATHNEAWRIENGDNGDIACDSYHNYKRDVEMLRELGVDFYRFSISWPRILPSGFTNHIAEDGIAYYNNLIDELVKYDIQPVVTIFHWDLPQRLQQLGGWTNPLIETWFKDFARVAFENFGDRVKTWITINEPHQICAWGYGIERFAPFLGSSGIGNYLCTFYVLKAHATAYHLYDDEFRPSQKGRIGFTNDFTWGEGASDGVDDIQAGDDYKQFTFGLYVHPIYHPDGDFPPSVRARIAARSVEQGYPRSRLPEFTPEEVEYIKGTADFFGLNHYFSRYIYRNESVAGMHTDPSMDDDINADTYYVEAWDEVASAMSRVAPWGLRKALKFVKDYYNNPEIIIFENGVSSGEGLEDDGRINYYRLYLLGVLDAIHEDGVNVTGYTAWSLMDNFEWDHGYSIRFGLYEVNFDDPARTRTARKSAVVYKEIARSRVVDVTFEPESLDISIN